MAYVPGCPTFPAVLGDWLATGYNFFAGVWPVAEGPNAVELAVLEWFRQWTGMPAGSGGLLTNGGSGATLTAIIAARHAAVGDDVSRLQRLTLYASDQAHSAALRAAWIAGVPRNQVRVLPSDADYRLRPSDVQRAIADDRAAGLIPLSVVVSAGTTNTGAVDPLDEIADVCAEERTWLHADAAYGGFAALTERGARLLSGLGRCDSVALDPHKWLFVPFECGSLLVREPERLRAAFQVLPDYLRDVAAGQDGVNFADYGEQLTRQSRALKVWLGVKYFGLAAIRGEIDRAIDHGDVRGAAGAVAAAARGDVAGAAGRAVLPRAPRGRRRRRATLDAFNERRERRDERRRTVPDLVHASPRRVHPAALHPRLPHDGRRRGRTHRGGRGVRTEARGMSDGGKSRTCSDTSLCVNGLPLVSALSPHIRYIPIVAQATPAASTARPAQIHMARAKPCVSRRPESFANPPIPAAAGSAAAEMRPASRATALFTPDATPASRSGAAASTAAVSGATSIESPRPNTTTAGRIAPT